MNAIRIHSVGIGALNSSTWKQASINKESISKLPCNKNTHTIYEGAAFIGLVWNEKERRGGDGESECTTYMWFKYTA